MLPLLLAVLRAALLQPASGCQDIQLYFGHLSSALEIESVTLRDPSTSCNCCGLCHQRADCKSLSFDKDSRECVLYHSVGGPGNFTRQPDWNHKKQFFFMPHASQSNEFCRSDADCLVAGEFCRGRICTTDQTVTCRDYKLMNGALTSHRYWAYIDGRELLVYCDMGMNGGGYTLLLRTSPGGMWTTTSRLNLTYYHADGTPHTGTHYSILWAADHIRDSSPDSTYSVYLVGKRIDKNGSNDWRDWDYYDAGVFFTPTKDISLLDPSGGPRNLPYTVRSTGTSSFSFGSGNGQLSFPYLQDNGSPILMHANMLTTSAYGSIIRTGGSMYWASPAHPPYAVFIFIRE